jgi:hypothetical protein
MAGPLQSLIPVDFMLRAKVMCHRMTKHVICGRIVTDEGADGFYDLVTFKDEAKSFEFEHPTSGRRAPVKRAPRKFVKLAA